MNPVRDKSLNGVNTDFHRILYYETIEKVSKMSFLPRMCHSRESGNLRGKLQQESIFPTESIDSRWNLSRT